MNSKDAGKLLYKYRHIDDDLCVEDVNTALELGIEALKHYQEQKLAGDIPESFLLPGETEE